MYVTNKRKEISVSMAIGIMIHFYILANYIPNHDDLAGIISNVDLSSSGRWLSRWATRISSVYTMHAVNGTLSLVYLSAAAVIIINLLKITGKLTKILILSLLLSFPTIAGILSYMQTADGYALAILLAVCGCALLQKTGKENYFGAICCFTLSCGIYQAYITFSVGVLYMLILKEFLNQGEIDGDLKKKIFRDISAVIVSLLAYMVILKIVLKISEQSLTSYSNINSMGRFTLMDMAGNLSDAYKRFAGFFFGYHGVYSIAVVIANFVLFLIMLSALCRKFRELHGMNKLYLIIAVLVMPVAFNSIEILKPAGNQSSILTTYAFVLFYVFAIYVLEEKRTDMSRYLLVLFVTIIVWNNYILTNEIYMKLDLTWEKSKLWAGNLLGRIENMDGFTTDMPIMIDGLGQMNGSVLEDAVLDKLDPLLLTDSYTFCIDSDAYNENLLFHYFRNFLDIKIIHVDEAEKEKIRQTKEYKALTVYPDDGSIEVIDNIIVVKVGI